MKNIFILTNARIGKDAEIREIGGQKQARFTVAESENYKDKSGNWQERTQWHDVVLWGAAAERAATKALKGVPVNVFGTYRIDRYEKNGERKTAYYVLADRIEYLYPKSQTPNQAPAQTQTMQQPIESIEPMNVEDDGPLPF